MSEGVDYRGLVRERYRASLMSNFKWREVFTCFQTHDPPLELWIKWVDGDLAEKVEAPSAVDERGAVFPDLGWRPYLAIETLSLQAYVERPRKSKLSSYQPIENLREALRALGKLPLEGTPGGGLRIIGHLPALAASHLTDAECRRLPPPFDAFAHALLAAWHDWRGYAEIKEAYGEPYLWVEVPPPPEADMNGPLWISTNGGEVTIGLDYGHGHFDWPPDRYYDPIQHIDDLLSERMVTYAQFIESWLSVSGECAAGETISLGNLRVSRLRVRSWRGTHNRDQTFAWPPSKRKAVSGRPALRGPAA